MSLHEVAADGGTLLELTNEREVPRDVVYASVTAREVVRVEVRVDDDLVDVVWVGAGGSHSWWTNGGGKLFPPDRFPNGLPPGSTLRVHSNGEAAFRIDWYD